ncbi:MAG: peptidoglycan-binding protein [Ilumatobacteraceae bacterium]
MAGARRISGYFPLIPGQRGEAIRDLQRRLGAAGFHPGTGTEAGFFGVETAASLRAFQQARGLGVDGVCGEYTWAGLVEASWRLGDRLLLLTAPNLRGDDVATLQGALGRIGFDCGKVDGIMGPRTAHALEDFQGNCGLVVDGICGPVTLKAIERVSRQSGTGPGVAMVRERDHVQSRQASLRQLRVVIGQFGGLSNLARALTRELRTCGAVVISVDEPDALAQAEAANRFSADIYLGFDATTDTAPTVAFYAVPPFESAGGRSLAEGIAAGLRERADVEPLVRGMRLQVLRETRMPAVLTSISTIRRTVDFSGELTVIIRDAVEGWAGYPRSEHAPR